VQGALDDQRTVRARHTATAAARHNLSRHVT
jgi:hypothetical protein